MLSSKSRFTLTPHRRASRRFTYGISQHAAANVENGATSDNATCFDTFQEPLADLAASFELMHSNFEQLKQVNDALVDFNDAFGAFLFGMTANGSSIHWPQVSCGISQGHSCKVYSLNANFESAGTYQCIIRETFTKTTVNKITPM